MSPTPRKDRMDLAAPDLANQALAMLRGGASVAETARRIGYSREAIMRLRDRAGIAPLPRGGPREQGRRRFEVRRPDAARRLIAAAYDDQRARDVARRFGVSDTTVIRVWKDAGVHGQWVAKRRRMNAADSTSPDK